MYLIPTSVYQSVPPPDFSVFRILFLDVLSLVPLLSLAILFMCLFVSLILYRDLLTKFLISIVPEAETLISD